MERSKKENRVAVVTGGSSGIGRETAKALRDAGIRVYEISRHDAATPGVIHLTADVTDEAAVSAAAAQVAATEGRLDILVTCAGFGISGAIEFTELAAAKKQLDVNFFGTVNAVKAVLPQMRRQGGGRIVSVSSVAAPIAIPFQTYYSVSKAGINTFIGGLRNEVRPYGIIACAVMPGDIRTGFTDAREKSPAGDEAYGGRISRSVAVMEKDERGGMDPAEAGAFLAAVAQKAQVRPLYTIGGKYKFFVWLANTLPDALISRLVYGLYAK